MAEPERFELFKLPPDPAFEAEWAAAQAAGSGAIADFLAGRLTYLFPSHEDTMRFLDEERASGEEFDRRLDERTSLDGE